MIADIHDQCNEYNIKRKANQQKRCREERREQVSFSVSKTAKKNVESMGMNACGPQHLRTGTARMAASEEEGTQESVNRERYKITYSKQAKNSSLQCLIQLVNTFPRCRHTSKQWMKYTPNLALHHPCPIPWGQLNHWCEQQKGNHRRKCSWKQQLQFSVNVKTFI